MTLATRPLTESFGAEVLDVDLTSIDASAVEEIRSLWFRNGILLFRGQSLTEKDMVDYSRQFGDLEIHVRREALSKEHPEIVIVSNVKQKGKPIGILADGEVGWHFDQIYTKKPALGSFLVAVTIPPKGGNTYFADMATAFERLPLDVKDTIDGRKAVQSYDAYVRVYSTPANEETKSQTRDLEHPLVRTHPLTGRKALYVCPILSTQIVGMPKDESDDLLNYLFEWSVKPEFVYKHEWQLGDALMWDNSSTMHRREPFDGTYDRVMKRTTIRPPPEHAVPF